MDRRIGAVIAGGKDPERCGLFYGSLNFRQGTRVELFSVLYKQRIYRHIFIQAWI